MEKIEIVKKILNLVTCATARQISVLAKVRLNEDISAGSVSGVLRTLEAKGKACSSRNERGANVYWLIEE